MNDLMIFEGHEVEAFELNGEVLFNPYHVAECLEISDVKRFWQIKICQSRNYHK